MVVHERMKNLAERISENAELVDEKAVRNLIKRMDRAKSVFLAGAGRSGYVAKAFAMRLMHLGYDVHVVGEATTPAITEKDLLIAVSGSGETHSIVSMAQAAEKMDAHIAAISSNPRSSLGGMCDTIIVVKGRLAAKGEKEYLARQLKGAHEPLAPMGTLFELSAMVFFDSLVEELMVLKGESEDGMKKRHTQLE
jgi:6-phospho-3-hexuloisomerase